MCYITRYPKKVVKRCHAKIYVLLLTTLGGVQASLRAQLPTITNQPASRALWTGGSVMFTVGVSNAGSLTYQWQLNTTDLPNSIITTVAGNGTHAYSGDGGAATDASLNAPSSVAVDASDNQFIADYSNNRIRKVSTNGIITTVAGNGVRAYSGDGGVATAASLSMPFGVAVDLSGNLFIADRNNARIRKVDTNGIITTVAGGGMPTYPNIGDGGAATNASLNNPQDVAVDVSGNLFIADANDFRIREVNTNGIITTVAGNGTNGYSGDNGAATNASLKIPSGVAVDASGNLFIADFANNCVRQVSTSGIITTFAGGGTPTNYPSIGDGGAATNGALLNPERVATDTTGNLFIADNGFDRIREVNTNGIITTIAGNGAGAPLGGAYSGDGGVATNASLNGPRSVTVDAYGNLFIADAINGRIRKVTNAQGPTLALNNVSAANAGNYQVVVTGPGGSVTSSVVTLTVATSPLIYRTVLNSDGYVTLNFVSLPGSTNVVLRATNLSPPVVWQPLSTNFAGADGDWQFTDTNAASNQMEFYRSLTP